MKASILFLSILFFIGCTNRISENKEIILSVVPEKVVDLESEKLPIEELLPTGIIRIDTFLVIVNPEEKKMLRIYNANTFEFIDSLLNQGRGPDEIIRCHKIWGEKLDNHIRLWIQAPENFLGILDLNRSLEIHQTCWERKFDFIQKNKSDFLYRPVFNLNDSIFLISRAEDRHYLISDNNVKKNSDGSITILSNAGIQTFPAKNLYWLKYDYQTSSSLDTTWYTDYKNLEEYLRISSTIESISPNRQKIVVAFHRMNQILLFDRKTGKMKLVTTCPEPPSLDQTEEKYKVYYSDVCCTNQFIFAFKAFSEDPRMGTGKERLIQVFDWEGHLKYQLNVSHPLKCPFLDEEKGYIYATDEEDHIHRYNIKAFL